MNSDLWAEGWYTCNTTITKNDRNHYSTNQEYKPCPYAGLVCILSLFTKISNYSCLHGICVIPLFLFLLIQNEIRVIINVIIIAAPNTEVAVDNNIIISFGEKDIIVGGTVKMSRLSNNDL